MSLRNKTIQIDTSGLRAEDSDHALHKYILKGIFYSVGFLAAGILFVFAPSLSVGEQGSTNVMAHRPAAVDISRLNYVEGVTFSMSEAEGGSYVVAGDKDRLVTKLRFSTVSDPFRLKELALRVEGLDDSEYSNVYMVSGDGGVYRGSEWNGYVKFKNLYLKGDVGEDLVFDLYMSVGKKLKFGDRFGFVLESVDDLNFTVYGDRAYLDVEYPMNGPFVSIIGGQQIF